MKTIAVAASILLLHAGAAAAQTAPAGSADPGKAAWARTFCVNCHGASGEGGFGPDLAGRGLDFAQFQRAVRKPWSIMPAWTEGQLPDETLQLIFGYMAALPRVKEVAAPRFTAPPTAPHAQQLWVNTFGCSQCHGPEMGAIRKRLGGDGGADAYPLFDALTYTHTDLHPKGIMGNYRRSQVPETLLREMFGFVNKDLGLRVPVTATLSAPSAGGNAYTLTVKNMGKPGVGLTAEDLTIALKLPPQAKIAGTTGAGYAGLVKDPELMADAATWHVKKLAAGDTQTYTVTLADAMPDAFKGSVVRWQKPEIRKPVNMLRNGPGFGPIPEKGDGVTVAIQAPRSTN